MLSEQEFEQIVTLHRPAGSVEVGHVRWCAECQVKWPCPTERLLRGYEQMEARTAAMREALNMRPHVLAFAWAMEERLRDSDDTDEWKWESPERLLSRIQQAVGELTRADVNHHVPEAIDVANVAMMLADINGVLSTENARMVLVSDAGRGYRERMEQKDEVIERLREQSFSENELGFLMTLVTDSILLADKRGVRDADPSPELREAVRNKLVPLQNRARAALRRE